MINAEKLGAYFYLLGSMFVYFRMMKKTNKMSVWEGIGMYVVMSVVMFTMAQVFVK